MSKNRQDSTIDFAYTAADKALELEGVMLKVHEALKTCRLTPQDTNWHHRWVVQVTMELQRQVRVAREELEELEAHHEGGEE